jgi:hypothetical protein
MLDISVQVLSHKRESLATRNSQLAIIAFCKEGIWLTAIRKMGDINHTTPSSLPSPIGEGVFSLSRGRGFGVRAATNFSKY